MQFHVDGKCRHLDFVHEFFQARDAAHFHRLRQRAIGPKRPVRDSEVEIVMQRPHASNPSFSNSGIGHILFAFQVQAFRGNLFEMNFHINWSD